MAVTPCQCEHESHFDGNPGHPYGKVPSDTRIGTVRGTFNMCAYCHNAGHMNIGKAGG